MNQANDQMKGFEGDRLFEHGQRVLVDILVAMVLVALETQRRKLRQDQVSQTRVDQQGETRPRPR